MDQITFLRAENNVRRVFGIEDISDEARKHAADHLAYVMTAKTGQPDRPALFPPMQVEPYRRKHGEGNGAIRFIWDLREGGMCKAAMCWDEALSDDLWLIWTMRLPRIPETPNCPVPWCIVSLPDHLAPKREEQIRSTLRMYFAALVRSDA